jgi:hypothetical protein
MSKEIAMYWHDIGHIDYYVVSLLRNCTRLTLLPSQAKTTVTAVLVDTAVLKHRNTAVYWNTAEHRETPR